jgi:hypothetical protein
MTWWIWLLIGIAIGLFILAVPMLWFWKKFADAWDRAWGY